MQCSTHSQSNRRSPAAAHSDSASVVQVVNVVDEIFHGTSAGTVIPFSAISNAAHLASESDCTTFGDIEFSTSLDTGSQQTDAYALAADAGVELGKIQTVFHGATLDQLPLWDVREIGNHAVGKTQPELDIGIDLGGAEKDDIAQTLTGTMFAGNRIGVWVDARETSASASER